MGAGRFFVLIGLEQDGGSQAAKNSPVDCFLVRGRVPPRDRVPAEMRMQREPSTRVGAGRFFMLIGLEQDGGPQTAKNSPVDCTVFTEIFGKFVISKRADEGIGPYGHE